MAVYRDLLDRLMGRPVLTDTDGVVGPDEQHLRFDNAARRTRPCIGKHEERADDGDRSAVQRHPVCDRFHCVLAHTEIDLSAAGIGGENTP